MTHFSAPRAALSAFKTTTRRDGASKREERFHLCGREMKAAVHKEQHNLAELILERGCRNFGCFVKFMNMNDL